MHGLEADLLHDGAADTLRGKCVGRNKQIALRHPMGGFLKPSGLGIGVEAGAIKRLRPTGYGLEPNRPAFEAIGRYVHEQGLAPRVVAAEGMFVPGVEAEAG